MKFPIAIAAIVVSLLFVQAIAAEGLPADFTASKIARIEAVVAKLMQAQGIPGLSVAVATGNQSRYSQGFGLANVEQAIPVNASSRFRTASVAKPMTAVMVMSLVEEGNIDLDAQIQTYCDDFPEKRWPITTRQLLGHLAGVRHYKNSSESTSTEHFFTLKSALSTFRDDSLLHEPGTKFLYSSFGYNLLGSVAEGASQQTFMRLLQDRVFTPAGMQHTVADDQLELISGRVNGYVRLKLESIQSLPAGNKLIAGELYNAPLHDTSMKIPGGGLLSTASDLVRFAMALNQGILIEPESRMQMWRSQKTSDGTLTNYGFGWQIGNRLGHSAVWHTGGQSGTSTVLLNFPERDTVVAIMCNLQNVGLVEAATSIADIALNASSENILPTDYTAAIEKLKSAISFEVKQKDLPAFSISLVDGEEIVWAEGFGFQDAKKEVPASADTVYRVGSVSKLFTDIAVMQLVHDGRLNLDAPIQNYLPDFKPKNPFGIPTTLRQLMSHQSGLVREPPVGNYFDPSEPTLAETVASLNNTTLVYKPETKTKYSNAAVAVVGLVLESQLDVSHLQRVRQTILDPLKMDSSSFFVTPEMKSKIATGWMRTYDGRRFAAPDFLLGTGPAGNMLSNVNDLSKFLICLFRDGATSHGRVLESETLKLMTTPIHNENGKPQDFGLGFSVEELDGYKKIGHGGAVYGFSTELAGLPERKVGVAAVASLDGSNGVVGRLSNYALRLMLAAKDSKPLPMYLATVPIEPDRAKQLVGDYRGEGSNELVKISELNGEVFMQRGSFRFSLRATSNDGRIVTDDAVGFGTIVNSAKPGEISIGKVTYQRIENTPPAEIPSRWRGLIGEYGWDHNTLYILEDHGQLYALIEWFYYYPLKEVSDDVFEFPDTGLYHGEGLHFTRDKVGDATEVVVAEVKFARREVGTKDGETFKIIPVMPIDSLREAALSASPPVQIGEYRDSDLVEINSLDSTIKLDIRYATTNNFTGAVFYQQPRAFMQRNAAEAVVRANKRLREFDLGILVHDAYRPWHVTKMFWDATPPEMKNFVANPANGSRHNRGCAVDLSLYDLYSGEPIQMVAGYDEFSNRAFPLYPGGTSRQRWYRQKLRQTMEAEGFTVYEFEWWHFDYKDWKQYRIGNLTFEEIDARPFKTAEPSK